MLKVWRAFNLNMTIRRTCANRENAEKLVKGETEKVRKQRWDNCKKVTAKIKRENLVKCKNPKIMASPTNSQSGDRPIPEHTIRRHCKISTR